MVKIPPKTYRILFNYHPPEMIRLHPSPSGPPPKTIIFPLPPHAFPAERSQYNQHTKIVFRHGKDLPRRPLVKQSLLGVQESAVSLLVYHD
jgi:hypothetical protein